jgi:hypothetical protein
VVPATSGSRSLSQVVADGRHGTPHCLHGVDEHLVDPLGISFGIKHQTGRLIVTIPTPTSETPPFGDACGTDCLRGSVCGWSVIVPVFTSLAGSAVASAGGLLGAVLKSG